LEIANALRAKFLVDGRLIFARPSGESSLILGWDFDSRIRLKHDRDDFPSLGGYLNSLASRRPTLNIHVLVWDFALIYALDRGFAVGVIASVVQMCVGVDQHAVRLRPASDETVEPVRQVG